MSFVRMLECKLRMSYCKKPPDASIVSLVSSYAFRQVDMSCLVHDQCLHLQIAVCRYCRTTQWTGTVNMKD